MNETFKNFLQSYFRPLVERECGLKKINDTAYSIRNDLFCVLLEIVSDRFNYPGRYGFNCIIDLVGLKPGIPVSGNLIKMIKQGHHPIAAVDLKEVLGLLPVPFELKNHNEVEIINELRTDFKNESVKKWWNIQKLADIENVSRGLYRERIIYGTAVYLAQTGNLEKSKDYFKKLRKNEVVLKIAASFGIEL